MVEYFQVIILRLVHEIRVVMLFQREVVVAQVPATSHRWMRIIMDPVRRSSTFRVSGSTQGMLRSQITLPQ